LFSGKATLDWIMLFSRASTFKFAYLIMGYKQTFRKPGEGEKVKKLKESMA
jgi:hypothetical protein